MASWIIHFRIAENLLKSFGGLCKTEFVFGNVAPDSGLPNAAGGYDPPKSVSHFQSLFDGYKMADYEKFAGEYLPPEKIKDHSPAALSFYLGYYCHLLTDFYWSYKIVHPALSEHAEENLKDHAGLINKLKGDWYNLDFLYLRAHPDLEAYLIFTAAKSFPNVYMPIFGPDAFDVTRERIEKFYSAEWPDIDTRPYHYLRADGADRFVGDVTEIAADGILKLIGRAKTHNYNSVTD